MHTVGPPPFSPHFSLEFITTYKKEGKENQTATVPIISISICVSNQESVANSSEAEDADRALQTRAFPPTDQGFHWLISLIKP